MEPWSVSTIAPTATPTPSGAPAAPAIANCIDFLTALIIGATGPSPLGSATRFSPIIAPSRVTRHDCTAPGISSTPQIGRAFGENQSGLAGWPPPPAPWLRPG